MVSVTKNFDCAVCTFTNVIKPLAPQPYQCQMCLDPNEKLQKPTTHIRIAFMSDPSKAPITQISSAAYLKARNVPFTTTRLTAQDIHDGQLTTGNFDVFYMLGGYAPNYFNALGDLGHTMIMDFVSQGGGFLGICAGAYYGAGRSNCGIRLIDVDVFDIENWARGSTDHCHIKFTQKATDVFGTSV